MTGHRSFSDLTKGFSAERKARVAETVAELRAEMELAEFREALHITQAGSGEDHEGQATRHRQTGKAQRHSREQYQALHRKPRRPTGNHRHNPRQDGQDYEFFDARETKAASGQT